MADKKRLFQPQIKGKWLHGTEPLEPVPEGPHYKRWYKTRDKLPPNDLPKNGNRLLKCSIDTPPWISVREGLDNFRTGFPPADNMIIRGPREGSLSTTAHRVPQPPHRKTHNKLSEGELLSELLPAQQAQKAFVEETKASLTPHPLARYPDLKEILPPDLLLMVLEELDPNRMLEDTWAYCEVMKERKKSRTKLRGKHPKEVNRGPPKPRQPGTSRPSRRRHPPPSQPRTPWPSRSGTPQPSRSGTPRPSSVGTPPPSRPRTPRPSQQGPPSQVKEDLLAKSSWDLLMESLRHQMDRPSRTSQASQLGLPMQINQDLPAKTTRTPRPSQQGPPSQVKEDLLAKSSWDLLMESLRHQMDRPSRTSQASQLGLPMQINQDLPAKTTRTPRPSQQGPPSQVKEDLLAKSSWDLLMESLRHQMDRPSRTSQASQLGLPMQINQDLPAKTTRTSWPSQPGPPDQVDGGPPDQVNQGPPGQVILAPQEQVNQDLLAEPTETSQASQPEPLDQVNGEPPDQVNEEPRKMSLLSCINKLFPEEKKKKKSSRKGVLKPPDRYRHVRREIREFCRWLDTFGDMGIDESFIMKQFEVNYTCTPTYSAGKIKKVNQIPVELYYSKELDDDGKREFGIQERDWERKLRKPPDPYKPNQVKIRYGAWYLKPNTWKKLINDEPWIDPKVLKEQEYQHYGRDLEPDIIDDLYGPIAFKDFIVSKGYRMPEVIEKLFLRKKWTYDSVKTPIDRVMKLISSVPDNTSDDVSDDD